MSRFLLDTSSLIDFSKEREPAHSRILAMIEGTDDVGVCAVNVAEFYSGLAPSDWPIWARFFGSLSYWDVPREAAALAGRDRYDFARRGRTLSTTDLLVAAVARHYDAIIVTDDLDDYPMTGVQLLSVRE